MLGALRLLVNGPAGEAEQRSSREERHPRPGSGNRLVRPIFRVSVGSAVGQKLLGVAVRAPQRILVDADIVTAQSYCVFDTDFGVCGVAWSDRGVTQVRLPEKDAAAVERRLRRRTGTSRPATPPPFVQAVIADI